MTPRSHRERRIASLGGAAVLLAVMSAGCADNEDPIESPLRWDLTFAHEFNGAAGESPNAADWVFDLGGFGWGNNELQYYTDRPDNVSMTGAGSLVITARAETFEGNNYTSGRIKTRALFEQEYGLFEARIKLPSGQGIWPAFWMLGNDCEGDICGDGETVWPEVGEIDIVELFGSDTERVATSVHGPGYAGGAAITLKHRLDDGAAFSDDFHVYGVEWDPSTISWRIDGQLVLRISVADTTSRGDWVFDHPFFMLLNVAVGGDPVGNPDATTSFPAEMLVDWVRVYERRAQ